MIIEVCVDSLESAITAIKAGADQVELVSLTEVGGKTIELNSINFKHITNKSRLIRR